MEAKPLTLAQLKAKLAFAIRRFEIFKSERNEKSKLQYEKDILLIKEQIALMEKNELQADDVQAKPRKKAE